MATLEIGPGPGTATREFVARGADPLVAVEPDARLADPLRAWLDARAAHASVHACAFEDADLEPGSFDLAVAATSFHWLEQRAGLERVACLLRPGGWWAMWWIVFGDPDQADPYHDATTRLLQRMSGDPRPPPRPFCLEVEARRADLAAGGFRDVDFEAIHTARSYSSPEIRELYASFSNVSRLPEESRERLLDELVRVADEQFGGRVERRLVTACYTARRPD